MRRGVGGGVGGGVVEEARLQFLPDCPIFSNIFSNQYFKVIGLQNT